MDEMKNPKELGVMEIRRILELLPHRYPLLLVDRVLEMNGDKSIVCLKNVSANEPYFQGHFPNYPVMPGVLIIEGLAQTAAVLGISNIGETDEPQMIYFMGIERAKFRRPVIPGDTLYFHVEKVRSRGRVWRFRGEAKVDGQIVAETEISAMIIDQADIND